MAPGRVRRGLADRAAKNLSAQGWETEVVMVLWNPCVCWWAWVLRPGAAPVESVALSCREKVRVRNLEAVKMRQGSQKLGAV